MELWLSLLQSFVLVAALSADAFAASFAYGTDRIRIPIPSLLVICTVCTGLLGLSLAAGQWIGPAFPPGLAKGFSIGLLLLIAVIRLFDSALKSFLRRHQPGQKRLHFCMAGICFILQIYVDSTAADRDASRRLSPGEAASLAFALSLDGLAVGFGAGLLHTSLWEACLLCFVTTAAAVLTGSALGRKLAAALRFDMSWLSGGLLLLLALLKLF